MASSHENEQSKQGVVNEALSLLRSFLEAGQVITPPQNNAARRAAKQLSKAWSSEVDFNLHKLTWKSPDWYLTSDNQVEQSVNQARLEYAEKFKQVYEKLRLVHGVPNT